MWDYDKLFAEGNIIGIKNIARNKVFNHVINREDGIEWIESYKNEALAARDQYTSFDNEIEHEYVTDFEIQYIICLNDKGQVTKQLFNREKDMPKSKSAPMPKLESGMFVTVFSNNGSRIRVNLGYVDKENNHIIYLSGGYDKLNTNWDENYRIVEVYRKNTRGFRYCTKQNLIWHEPNYVHKDFNIGKE